VYGHHEASNQFSSLLDKILQENGFKPAIVDECFYVKNTPDGKTILYVHVNDMLLTCPDKNSMSSREKYMFQRLHDAQGEESADKDVRHAFVYKKIMAQIAHMNLRTPRAFMNEAYFDDQPCENEDKENYSPETKILQAVGVSTIVSIYCDRSHEFGSQFFEERLTCLGFSLLCVLKFYALLEDLRQKTAWDDLVDPDDGEPAKKMR